MNLIEFALLIWRRKVLLFVLTGAFASFSVVAVLFMPNVYRSTVLLAPSEDARGAGVSKMASQLSGLASLAGVNLGAGGGASDQVALAIAILKSRHFQVNFIRSYALEEEVFAAKGWVRAENRLLYNSDIYDSDEGRWVRSIDASRTSKPTDWELYKKTKLLIRVSQDEETGFVSLTFEHFSPYLAKSVVDNLVASLNEVVRKKDIDEATESIKYLKKQLSLVSVADMRSVFFQLIEEQTKKVMLASVRDEYVFTVIDPAVVAEEKFKPKRALICIFITIVGVILAVIIVLSIEVRSGSVND